MVRNYTLFIVFIAVLLSNFQSKAHFSQVPENIYEFELQMVEHSIGTGVTMIFLLNRSSFSGVKPYFQTLMEHQELIHLRAKQHDLSKFAHTPDFVKRYYPATTTTHLSAPVLKYYGYDIRTNPDSLDASEIAEAKNAFGQLNVIDDRLLDELVNEYAKGKNLSVEIINRLKKELYQFEHMSDLLNRKMFENILRFRKNFGRDGRALEVFEFGRAIKLDNGNKNDWNSGEHTKKIALEYIHSPALYHLILNIQPQRVVETYLQATKDSPFLQNPTAVNLRDKTIERYVNNREAIAPMEQKRAKRKISRAVNFCRSFYAGK